MGSGLGTKKDMVRQCIRIALQNVLQILKAHKVQDDLKRGFHDWDLPPLLVMVLLISLTQV